MTETTTTTIEAVRADLEAEEADARARRRQRGGGNRIVTAADRAAARERHILKTAEVIDRAAANAPIEVEGACVFCGQRRGLQSERQVPTGPTRVGWKGVLGFAVFGEACSKCDSRVTATQDLAEFFTDRLWDERPDLMKRAGLRRRPHSSEVAAGANPNYDVLDDWQSVCWAWQVLTALRAGHRTPSKPKSPFAWVTYDEIEEGATS